MGVQYADTGPAQFCCDGTESLVQLDRAQGAADHQQRRSVGVEPEILAGLRPQRRQVEAGQRPPDRIADHPRALEPRSGHRGRRHRGEPGADPVGNARPGVRLVHHHRDPVAHRQSGGQVGRQGNVATESDDHIDLLATQYFSRRDYRFDQPVRDAQQIQVELAPELHFGDQFQLIARLRHQDRLQTTGRAKAGDLHALLRFRQSVGNRKGGLDMPGTPTPCDQHSGGGHGRTVRPRDEALPVVPLPSAPLSTVRLGSTKARPCQSVAGRLPGLSPARNSPSRPSPLRRSCGGAFLARRPRPSAAVSRAWSRLRPLRSRLRRSGVASRLPRRAASSRAAG